MASKIKKGDKVFIISGKDKGKEGEVTKIIKSSQNQDKALVQGINIVKKDTESPHKIIQVALFLRSVRYKFQT